MRRISSATNGFGRVALVLWVVGCSSPAEDDDIGPDCPTSEAGYPKALQETECRVFDLVNARRAQGGDCGGEQQPAAPPLRMHPVLRKLARDHAVDMATRGYFDHTNPDGLDPFARMQAAGYRYSTAAENIAQGAPTPESVMELWLTSGGHCKNLMNPNFEDIGVGYTDTAHHWVQTFGRVP